MSNATKTAKRSDFKKYFQFMWRSLNIQASWNYERQMNMGFLYGIAPTLDELYPNENDPEQLAHKKEAYEREMVFYNCTPQTSAFTLGLAASMEEQYAADRENFNPETINAVKTSLMGPLSGVGDSFFQGTVRLIAFGLGISLAQQGSVAETHPCPELSRLYMAGRLAKTAKNVPPKCCFAEDVCHI